MLDREAMKMAKMEILKELIQDMMKDGGESLSDGLQKVSVMAKDKQGLEKGLDKAQEIIGQEDSPEMESPEMESSEEMDESSDNEMLKELFKKRMGR